MFKHTTDEIVMIKPKRFDFNEETAVDNTYQNNDNKSHEIIQKRALEEFNGLVDAIRSKGIKVNIIEDSSIPHTPDSIFPNNWFSSHEGGLLVIYPMFAENRQEEIYKFRSQVEEIAKNKNNGNLQIIDYSVLRDKNMVLEATGAIVIDKKNKTAYTSLSERSNQDLFIKWCQETGHSPCYFKSYQDGQLIYHTNIMMGIGEKKALVCLQSIDEKDRGRVRESLENDGNEIIEIYPDQLKAGLGNTLELKGSDGNNFIVMSTNAYKSLTDDQKLAIEKTTEIVHADVSTIEFYGGGSARCMIAEIF